METEFPVPTQTSPTGVLVVDKPLEVSSFAVVSWARRQFGVRTIGHAGTLDPLATGVMVVLVGKQFTRLQSTFLSAEKEYVFTVGLGITSDSFDLETPVRAACDPSALEAISIEQIQQKLTQFLGDQMQIPPLYSAVQVGGERLYRRARRLTASPATAPSPPPRHISITKLTVLSNPVIRCISLIENSLPCLLLRLRVMCSAGTYVRGLARDIGSVLQTGGMVLELRRVRSGGLTMHQAVICPLISPLEKLRMPVETIAIIGIH